MAGTSVIRFTKKDVAETVGVHRNTLARHIEDGEVDPYDLVSLAHYVANRTRKNKKGAKSRVRKTQTPKRRTKRKTRTQADAAIVDYDGFIHNEDAEHHDW